MEKTNSKNASEEDFLAQETFEASDYAYAVVIAIVICLVFIVKRNRAQQAEREAYKEEFSKNETEEDIGDISITMPTNAPDNAAGKDTTSSSDKSSEKDSFAVPYIILGIAGLFWSEILISKADFWNRKVSLRIFLFL